jgi:hypothetical protein
MHTKDDYDYNLCYHSKSLAIVSVLQMPPIEQEIEKNLKSEDDEETDTHGFILVVFLFACQTQSWN